MLWKLFKGGNYSQKYSIYSLSISLRSRYTVVISRNYYLISLTEGKVSKYEFVSITKFVWRSLCYIFSLIKGLANSNAQSASFKMLEQALEMDLDLSQLHGSAKAPREEQSGDNPYLQNRNLVGWYNQCLSRYIHS